MAKTFVSYSARPDVDYIQVSAWVEDTPGDFLGLEASESAKFGWLQDEEAVTYLTDRGCDPINAQLMVGVASRGFNSVEIWPSERRVEVRGENRHHVHAGPY